MYLSYFRKRQMKQAVRCELSAETLMSCIFVVSAAARSGRCQEACWPQVLEGRLKRKARLSLQRLGGGLRLYLGCPNSLLDLIVSSLDWLPCRSALCRSKKELEAMRLYSRPLHTMIEFTG